MLLTHLGVNPWATETTSWPLQVHPRTLAVLAQVLLLKQDPQEKVRNEIENCMDMVCEQISYKILNYAYPNEAYSFKKFNQ